MLSRRKERLEEPRFVLGCDPGSEINNGNLYFLIIGTSC